MSDVTDIHSGIPGSIRARHLALAELATCPTWLAGFRSRAQRELAAAQFPERKSETWKYTSLHALAVSGALDTTAHVSRDIVPVTAVPTLDAWRLVFVNGRFDAGQSHLPADAGIVISSLVGLPDSEQAAARELLALTCDSRLPFAAANSAAFADGALIRVCGEIARPLHVILHATGDKPATAQTRLLVRVEPRAVLTLIEQYTGNSADIFTNAVTAIDLGRDAKLTHIRLQFADRRQYFIGSLHLRQQAGSRCEGFQLMTGSKLRRNDVTCVIAGPGAELALQGVYLAGAGDHVDNQVCIEHVAPHGTSDQLFKGLIGGNGRAVFNGRIHIHPGAKQTAAELVNNNLLLSADAEVDTKPELEIYNDDVKCAHGATVGQLNEAGVFYLRSRGIAQADAELMLSLGFVNALVDTVPVAGLAGWIRDECVRWFATHSSPAATTTDGVRS